MMRRTLLLLARTASFVLAAGWFLACAGGQDDQNALPGGSGGAAGAQDGGGSAGESDAGGEGGGAAGDGGPVDASWPDASEDAEAGGAGTAGAGGTAGTAGASGAGGTGGVGPCGAEACMVNGSCVDAGEPNPTNPCEACLPTVHGAGWSSDPANVTCDGLAYWSGVQRPLPVTPYGREDAISCHNCYTATLSGTLDKLHAA